MSMPERVTVNCPRCGFGQEFTLWRSLNATLDPEQKRGLVSGELTRLHCASCRAPSDVVYPMLYHDMERRLMIHLLAGEAAEAIPDLGLGVLLKDYRLRLVDTRHDLVEKILLDDAGLDDQTMEWFKVVVRARMESDPGGELYFERFDRDAAGQEVVAFAQVTPQGMMGVTLPRPFFDEFVSGSAVLKEEPLASGEWHRVNRAQAEAVLKKYL